jgi:hypothetical protein
MPWDPSITQKVREALLEAGHSDLVVETLAEHFKTLERRLETLERDNQLAKLADQKRVTDTGVQRIIDGNRGRAAINWGTWAVRALLLGVFSIIGRLAWKGLHAP